jgi:hypothetical protein
MSKLLAGAGGLLIAGSTIVMLFAALFAGQLSGASYTGGACIPPTLTATAGASVTPGPSPTGTETCAPYSGQGSVVAHAALAIAAHLSGNPDVWYDSGMPAAVLQFWADACPPGAQCWLDWQEGSLQCVMLVTGTYALAGSPLPAAGNAIDFWSLYQNRPGWLEVPSSSAPLSERGMPMPGDIMVWWDPPPAVGHVAIVVGVKPPVGVQAGSVTFAEANGPGPIVTETLLPDLTVLTWSHYTVLGYIRPVGGGSNTP